MVQCSHLTNNGASFVGNSYTYLNKSYLSAPSAVYFSGDYSVSAWVNLQSYDKWTRLFDFSAGGDSKDNILVTTSSGTNGQVVLNTYQGAKGSGAGANSFLSLNTWTLVTVTVKGTNAQFYYNTSFVGSGSVLTANNLLRTTNYIGKANWDNPLSNMFIKNFKIYNVAIGDAEIALNYNSFSGNKI